MTTRKLHDAAMAAKELEQWRQAVKEAEADIAGEISWKRAQHFAWHLGQLMAQGQARGFTLEQDYDYVAAN